MPDVSIIMNCLNGEKYLREAIDSIYVQTYNDWEIIFWDNASTDNSAEIANSYDSRLRYFRGEKTVPLYSARNLALKQAKGRYIAFLDTDDIWLPQKLEWQLPLIKDNDKVGLVCSNIEILEVNGRIRNGNICRWQPNVSMFRQLLRHYTIHILTAIISRASLDASGGQFDESLKLCGDTDLFLRIAHDWDIKYLHLATARYREHGENLFLKCADDFPVELEYIINKLSSLYEDFNKNYEMEIIELRMRLQKGLAVSKWKSGNSQESRRLLFKHLLCVRSFILLYLLSFFSYNLISSIRNSILFSWIRQLKSN